MLQIIHYEKNFSKLRTHSVGDDVDDANCFLSVEQKFLHALNRIIVQELRIAYVLYVDVRNIMGSWVSSEFVRQVVQQHFFQQLVSK